MKKILSIILCTAMTFSLFCTTVLAATPLPDDAKITIRVVDKNDAAVANANIVLPYNARWKTYNYNEYTDKNGEIRLYNNDDYKSSATKKEKYSVHIIMHMPTDSKITSDAYVREAFTVDLNNKKAGSVTVLKLKSVDTKEKVYQAKDRTDVYIKNFKGGPVSNMKVTLHPSQVPQLGSASFAVDNVPVPNMLTGYTDNDGRVSFLKVPKDEYTVKFSWLGGESAHCAIDIAEKTGIRTYDLVFDETLLEVK